MQRRHVYERNSLNFKGDVHHRQDTYSTCNPTRALFLVFSDRKFIKIHTLYFKHNLCLKLNYLMQIPRERVVFVLIHFTLLQLCKNLEVSYVWTWINERELEEEHNETRSRQKKSLEWMKKEVFLVFWFLMSTSDFHYKNLSRTTTRGESECCLKSCPHTQHV